MKGYVDRIAQEVDVTGMDRKEVPGMLVPTLLRMGVKALLTLGVCHFCRTVHIDNDATLLMVLDDTDVGVY